MTSYYKVLTADRKSCHGGSAVWTPKKWMPKIEGELIPCENGYHVVSRDQLLLWLGEAVWECEVRGEVIADAEKSVVREARITKPLVSWTERNQRLFAADCAERVLPAYEKQYPKDDRPRKAIEVARLFADGKATREELDAARAAARGAAGDAARAAAGVAARVAARDAAWAAAWAAEGKWQTERLWEYLEGKR